MVKQISGRTVDEHERRQIGSFGARDVKGIQPISADIRQLADVRTISLEPPFLVGGVAKSGGNRGNENGSFGKHGNIC